MIELSTQPNQDVLLSAQLSINDTGLYVQAEIYNINDLTTVVETVNLDEIGQGAYAKKWTNNGEIAKYWVRLFVYTDSGYTTLSEIDRPAEISVNVGHYQGGGYIGASSGSRTTVRLKDLSDEEIKRIAKAVKEILQPELDKKSEFNPKKEIVKIEPIKFPEINIPEMPEIPKYNEQLIVNQVNELKNNLIKLNGELNKTQQDIKDYLNDSIIRLEDRIKQANQDSINNFNDYIQVDQNLINNLNNYIKDSINEIKQSNGKYINELTEKNYININNDDKRTAYERFIEALPSRNFPLLLMLLKKMNGADKKKAFVSLINFYPKELKEIKKFL